MTIEEIVHGESKNIEFKVMLPKDSEKYTKTIVAFANTQGGRLIIGIDDETHEVAGVDGDAAFQIMDKIANAVSDSCIPQIVPDIELQTVDNRTVVVATVIPGPNRPYYLKSKGKENGTFIRVAGTSRPAHPEKIKELEMEGARISWDELTCVGYEATEKEIRKLCRDIMKYRERAGLPGHKVTRTQLVNWKLLKNGEDSFLASNAFVLLTSDYFPFSKTQCAVFKGKERRVFLDKREFTGPIYEQIENAAAFVLRNIQLGARIEGLIRKEDYELPVEAIREMIINAHCHRNLSDSSCVQVAVYDDRLEVTSPGGLYNGITYEEVMNGRSKLRNRVIAHIFNQMGLVEAWGTGIKRIMEAAEEYELPTPKVQVFDDMFRINLYRRRLSEAWVSYSDLLRDRPSGIREFGERIEESSEKVRRKFGESSEKVRRKKGENSEENVVLLNETQSKILELIRKNSRISAKALAELLSVSSRAVEKNIKLLKNQGFLIRHGSPKSGYWEVINK
ncbi:MAG: HTH domain-containing protein [Lachnospiraceae bacterium]|uniref:ATP-binding protein n=1 Tax=Candidatus Merdisoma sp. JLR.KK006 TaxID=3112626 RepID=UPI002FEFD284|nr:HTH domain-containing protein [Lachnospiraceae bacterium]